MTAKTTFLLYLVKRLIVTLRCAVSLTTYIIFSTFSLKFKCKICVQKEVIHNLKNNILVTWPARNLLILRKWFGFEKLNHYYFVLRYHPLILPWRQNHITFIFKTTTMSHVFLTSYATNGLSLLAYPGNSWLITRINYLFGYFHTWTTSSRKVSRTKKLRRALQGRKR